MRKITLSFITFLVTVGVQAQNSHSLTTSRNAYRATDALVKQQVEFKDPGSSGRNLHWDFSTVQPLNESYKLSYSLRNAVDTSSVSGLEHNTRYYYRQQRDSLQAVGYENSTTYMEYMQPELRMHFPFAYGDTLFSYFTGKGEYCHRIPLAVKGYTRIMADAEGELKLPQFTTVKKALRVRTLRHYTETGKDSVEMTLDTYSWYAAGIRYPVFESIKTMLSRTPSETTASTYPSPQGEGAQRAGEVGEGAGGEVIVFSTSFYYSPELQTSQVQTDAIAEDQPQAAVGAAAVFTEAHYMPNPVEDNLYITFKLVRAAKVWFTVHNNTGIALCQTAAQNLGEGYNSTTVRMSGLVPGVYSLYVHVDDMVMRLNVVKK